MQQFINLIIKLSQGHGWRLAAIIILDLLLFGGSNAAEVSSWVLIVALLALAATIYQLVYSLLSLLSWYGLKVRRRRRLSFWITAVIGGLLALHSIGELGPRDVAVLLPLAAVAYLYSAFVSGD